MTISSNNPIHSIHQNQFLSANSVDPKHSQQFVAEARKNKGNKSSDVKFRDIEVYVADPLYNIDMLELLIRLESSLKHLGVPMNAQGKTKISNDYEGGVLLAQLNMTDQVNISLEKLQESMELSPKFIQGYQTTTEGFEKALAEKGLDSEGSPVQNIRHLNEINKLEINSEKLRNTFSALTQTHPKISLYLLQNSPYIATATLIDTPENPGIDGLAPIYLSDESLAEIVLQQQARQGKTLVLHDENTATDLMALAGKDNIKRFQINDGAKSLETVNELLNREDIKQISRVIAVGNHSVKNTTSLLLAIGKTNDIAIQHRTVSIPDTKLLIAMTKTAQNQLANNTDYVSVPTTLGSNSSAAAIGVLEPSGDIIRSESPRAIVIPQQTLTDLPGMSSAASVIDSVASTISRKASEAVTLGLEPSDYLSEQVYETLLQADWFIKNHDKFNASELGILASMMQAYPSNPKPPLGFDHDFAYAIINNKPDIKDTIPHGVLVGWGALLNLKAIAEKSNNQKPYNMMMHLLTALNVPRTQAEIAQMGLDTTTIANAISEVIEKNKLNGQKSGLGMYLDEQENSIEQLINRTFQ